MRRCLLLLISFVLFSSVSVTQAQQSQPSPPGLSFEFYRAHVEPIFLARRAGHARCYACHALGAGEGNAPSARHAQQRAWPRTKEHKYEAQSPYEIACRLLLQIKNKI